MARWQIGYASDCKSVKVGSIPARASTHSYHSLVHRLIMFMVMVCSQPLLPILATLHHDYCYRSCSFSPISTSYR